jgi:hypothetical protein
MKPVKELTAMNSILRTGAAIAVLILAPNAVQAACAPSITAITDGVSIDQGGCHVQIQNPEIVPVGPTTEILVRNPADGTIGSDGGAIVTYVGTALSIHEGEITALQTNDGLQDGAIGSLQTDVGTLQGVVSGHTTAIGALQSQTALQQGQLDAHEGRLDANDTKNGEQDAAIATEKGRNDDQDTTLGQHDARITAEKDRNDTQDGTLATHTTQIAGHETRIGSLETVTAGHETRLNAHDALLSQHSAQLEDHSRGLAISMAMPDAWLSDKKSFGIFGAVGGFDDQTAVGFAAIGRIDETWTVNSKLGFDTEGKNFGWQVGAGAQW